MSIREVAGALLEAGEALETGVLLVPVDTYEEIVGNENLPDIVFILSGLNTGQSNKLSGLRSSHKFLNKGALEKIVKLGR